MDKIRLTEADLHRIVKESVKNVIAEMAWRKDGGTKQEAQEKRLGMA